MGPSRLSSAANHLGLIPYFSRAQDLEAVPRRDIPPLSFTFLTAAEMSPPLVQTKVTCQARNDCARYNDDGDDDDDEKTTHSLTSFKSLKPTKRCISGLNLPDSPPPVPPSKHDALDDEETQALSLNSSLRSPKRRLLDRLHDLDVRPSLPPWISRFLGYRRNGICRPIWALQWLETFNIPLVIEDYFFAIFCTVFGMICVMAVNSMSPFATLPIPLSLGFVGALAVILYLTPHSPTAAPRNVLLSHLFASLLATVIAKLFLQDRKMRVQVADQMSSETVWIWACVAVTLTLIFQKTFNLIHPPAGGTALLGTIQPSFISIGWIYVGFVMSSVAIMVGTALVWGNVGRRFYPVYWFTPPSASASNIFPHPTTKDFDDISDAAHSYHTTNTEFKDDHSVGSPASVVSPSNKSLSFSILSE